VKLEKQDSLEALHARPTF